MSNYSAYPPKYLIYNAQNSKNLAIIMEIEGLETIYGITDTYTYIRYGDENLVYGLPGAVYGGLRNLKTVKPYIILDSQMSIMQRIEPEQGKGSVGNLTMSLIDYQGEVSRIIAPGIVIPEIILKPEFKIWLGYTQTSYPDDFLLAYRGYCTQTVAPPGKVQFQISDSSVKKRQPIFDVQTSILSESIDAAQTTIPINSTLGFYEQILGPNATYDPLIGTFIQVDDEIMEYGVGDLDPTQITVTRGVLGSLPATHEQESTVTNTIQLGKGISGINSIELMLKLMLSGWNGPCESDVPIVSFVYTYSETLGFNQNTFLLRNKNAVLDYGLAIGDYFTITGASNPANNLTGRIKAFGNSQYENQLIYTDLIFELENPATAVVAFRSQFDTFPIAAGLKMRMRDIDVADYLYIRKNYFNASATSNMQFYIKDSKNGKDFMDSQVCLPLGCYAITRFGRSSLAVTKPPLPTAGKLVQLDYTNVINPDKIQNTRSANSRSFYNNIKFTYNQSPTTGDYGAVQYFIDLVSENSFGFTSTLPITADGLRRSIGGGTIALNRGTALLNRYKKCVIIIDVTTNWSVGSLIEVSDIVILKDNGNLKIMNYETGERNLGIQLFEVTDRTYNIMEGTVKLKLMGGLGFSVDSRFGLISPSSQTNTGCTTTSVRLVPSYGQTDIQVEVSKWNLFTGLPVLVHNFDYSVTGSSVIMGVGTDDSSALTLSPPLAFAPSAGMIVDIPPYPEDALKSTDALYKLLYAHISPSVPVSSGISETQFVVDPGYGSQIIVGNSVILRTGDSSFYSPEVPVVSVVGDVITVGKTLTYTPASGNVVEGIGFRDHQSFYRYG